MIEPRALKVETELALIGLLYEDNQRFKSPPPPTIELSKRKEKKKKKIVKDLNYSQHFLKDCAWIRLGG